MPHGGIALDPTHFNTTNATSLKEAWEIHEACKTIGKAILELNPDIVLLSTPHGIADLQNFVFYMNPLAEGFADTDNCACPPCCYNASINIDVNVTEKILGNLMRHKNVSGLSGYGPPGQSSEPFPLRWGEVIPVHFIPGLNSSSIKFAVLSQPSRRYTQDVQMIPELLSLGASLYEILEASPKRIAVIVSADLAHTHLASGPYGYSNTSEPFDKACSRWATTLDRKFLLVQAASIVDKALSCGFTGFVMLHGLMEAGGLQTWQSRVLVNHHPSYYGMMVASFYRDLTCEKIYCDGATGRTFCR
ncbi:protein CA_C1420-like [Elysia marginata]|uniref:Protein CA_C1420-like n=1 Tax=Elysia marginata TaxID=1093978 RepID=A0AAV4GPG1_9GAST|nr:protein CA_C1420-like [Elysia marginata]